MLPTSARGSWDFTHILTSVVGLRAFLTASVTSCWNLSSRHSQTLRHACVVCVFVKLETGRKIERQNRNGGRAAQEYVKPKGLQPLEGDCSKNVESSPFFRSHSKSQPGLGPMHTLRCVLKQELSYCH